MATRKANWKTEAIAGITTFFTMSYIIVVNPSILCTPGTNMPFSGVMTATVALSFAMTLMMGLYAKLPFAVAPGMGINAFFAFTLILGRQIPWPVALGLVFWAGVLFLLISLTPLRVTIAQAIPVGLRNAAAAGIGIFLTFIGLKNAGLVTGDPITLVRLGSINVRGLLALGGTAVIFVLMRRKNPFAFLVGIFGITFISYLAGWVERPASIFSLPDFQSTFFKLDIFTALQLAFLPSILSVFLTDLFDSIATFVGVSTATGLLDKKGNPKNLKEGLLVDAFATFGAGLFGSSSGTAYIESSAGIEVGGRTGLSSVFTALCFLPCLFVAPLAGMVPLYATAPVLILVGALMFRAISGVSFEKLEDLIPNFLTIVLIPLTFSITQGILWGFVFHVVLYCLCGRRREISFTLYLIAIVSAALLVIEHSSWSYQKLYWS